MRIDRFLFFIRLAKSRTLAQALVGAGHVRIDGRHATRTSDVKPGCVIALPLNGTVRILRVLHLPTRRGPAAEARAAYEEIADNVSQQGGAD